MATVYSNALNLFNLTAKTAPTGTDLVPVGDSAVTGVPLKQATLANFFTGAANIPTNNQNTNYSVVAADRGKVILSNQTTLSTVGYTYTLLAPGTAGSGWYCYFVNQNLSGAGADFLTPASGKINSNTSYILNPGQSAFVYCDGTNYFAITNTSNWGVTNSSKFIAALPSLLAGTLSTTLTQTQGALLNSNVVVFPFYVNNNCAISSASINVSVQLAASTATVGIYKDNGYSNAPAAAAALGAVSIATTAAGVVSGTFGTAIQLYANNFYWAAIQTSSAVTLSLGNILIGTHAFDTDSLYATGMVLGIMANAYSAGNLPSWSASGSSRQNYLPWIAFTPT